MIRHPGVTLQASRASEKPSERTLPHDPPTHTRLVTRPDSEARSGA
jgi:hypothetical protein